MLTQRRALVSQARVGLGRGVAGGGLTRWANSYRFCLWPQFSLGLGVPLDKLSPVKATTLGGAFHWRCGALAAVRQMTQPANCSVVTLFIIGRGPILQASVAERIALPPVTGGAHDTQHSTEYALSIIQIAVEMHPDPGCQRRARQAGLRQAHVHLLCVQPCRNRFRRILIKTCQQVAMDERRLLERAVVAALTRW